jgi:hypothetical protein
VSALLATSAAAVLTLWATRPHLAGYPTTLPADEVARVACWAIAAAVTARLSLGALSLSITVVGAGVGRVRRGLRWSPWIARRALRASLAGTLAVAPPPPVTVHVGTDGRLAPGPQPPSPALPSTTTTTPRPEPRRSLPPSNPTLPRRYGVQPGDNLWVIARADVARRANRDPSDRDIAAYWLRVIAANRATLRSGDPNLIYPGEIVELPNA